MRSLKKSEKNEFAAEAVAILKRMKKNELHSFQKESKYQRELTKMSESRWQERT